MLTAPLATPDLAVSAIACQTGGVPGTRGDTMTEEQAEKLLRYLNDIRKGIVLLGGCGFFFVIREFGLLWINGLS
jgi:hypothetical protein